MIEYPKIETLLDRDDKFHVIENQFRLPEFKYLADNIWSFTEKVDGTNIRVIWKDNIISFAGKTNNAQIPLFLIKKLQEIFTPEKFLSLDTNLCLYGEGYGAKIQKGGGNYKSDGVDFVLFDIRIGEWWLERDNIVSIASKLGISIVPEITRGTLWDAIKIAKQGFTSTWGNFPIEGLVVKPLVELCRRNGQRIIGKIKTKDFSQKT